MLLLLLLQLILLLLLLELLLLLLQILLLLILLLLLLVLLLLLWADLRAATGPAAREDFPVDLFAKTLYPYLLLYSYILSSTNLL